MKGKIIVFGIAFWYPLGGVAFQFLHYLLGLRRLGYDVYYVEDSARHVYDPLTNDFVADASANVAAVGRWFDAHGFAGKWAFRGNYHGGRCYGISEEALARLYREADAFLNVTGSQEIREEHLQVPRRVYVETDPVASQIQVAQGNARTIEHLAQHDIHFSYGENLGKSDCLVPVTRFEWLPTRQPVILELWAADNFAPSRPYTTITTWENRGRDMVFNGQAYYWSKHHEFLKFLDLPGRLAGKAGFELAVGVDKRTGQMLHDNGWGTISSMDVSRDFEMYRRFVQESRGEFTVAKDQNIRLRSGWFSDRDACYLAAGRPVITQETGFSHVLPVGEGLFGFRTFEEIAVAIEKIESDYARACRRAREIAAEYFSAETVLRSLLERAGL